MKKYYLLSAVLAVFIGTVNATECEANSDITNCIAKDWKDVEGYKESVYLPFFEKVGFDKEYLEKRWTSLEKLYTTQLVSIMLLQKAQNPIGFLTVEQKNDNALLYPSPILLSQKEIEYVVDFLLVNQYNGVNDVYCLASTNKPALAKMIESLGFKQISNDRLPITPNKAFTDDIEFLSFQKTLRDDVKYEFLINCESRIETNQEECEAFLNDFSAKNLEKEDK